MPTLHRFLTALSLAIAVAGLGASAAQQSTAPQPSTAPGTVDELLQSADRLLREQKGNQALPLFEEALRIAAERGLEPQEAEARSGIGEILLFKTQYASARDEGLKALTIYERLSIPRGVGRVSHLLSVVEEMSGHSADARTHAERAVAAFDSTQDPRGRAIATLQLLRVTRLEPAAARALYARAIGDARAAGDARLEGDAQHGLGDMQFAGGLYEEALDSLLRAEAIFQRVGEELRLGTVYNSLGRVYRAHGRLDEALKFQLKALGLHEKVNDSFTLLQSLNAVATVYQRMGDLTAARAHYERALDLAEKSSSQRVQDLVRASLGTLLLDEGQFARGAGALEQVIANGVDAFPGRRHASLSYAYEKMARPRDALDAATKAVDGCVRDEESCIFALGRRARAQAALGDRQAALADVNAALTTLESVRARLVPDDFFKRDFLRSQEGIYSLAIALQVGENQDRLALETAELARSRAFLDLLASRDVSFKAKDRVQLASLRETTSSQTPQVALEPAPALRLALRGPGAETGASAPPVVRASPSALELRSFVTASPSSAGDLVATSARLRSTLVVYWVGEDEIFVWVVTPDGGVHARRVGVLRSKLLDLIRATAPFADNDAVGARSSRGAIVTRGSSNVALQGARLDAWRELYDVLIKPVRDLLPRATGSLLTIVPQGPLLNVSFAALRSARGRYLLEDYALHYAPAGAVLQFTAPKRRADARSGGILLVADPTLPRLSALDRPLARLPGARSEAAAIARLVPPGRTTVLEDAGATEARARSSAAGKAVLHFATHAIVSDEDPFGSFLALGPTTGTADADGRLTAGEVYGLELEADLVVLSACRSAGGRVTGDGISAFARAFIYAGTASLVASLWDVADEPTNRLLPEFYRAWLSGESKSRALRRAQLQLLGDLRAGRVRVSTAAGVVSIPEHPVFWAGFALFGEPD